MATVEDFMNATGEQMVALDKITVSEEIQIRSQPNTTTAETITEVVKAGGRTKDPVWLVKAGPRLYLADGFGRHAGYAKAEATEIPAIICPGKKDDAMVISALANLSNASSLTGKDRREAVVRLLQHKEWSEWSNTKLAAIVGVSEGTIRNIRKELAIPQPDVVKTVRQGKVVKRDISKAKAQAPAPKPPAPVDDPPVPATDSTPVPVDPPAEDPPAQVDPPAPVEVPADPPSTTTPAPAPTVDPMEQVKAALLLAETEALVELRDWISGQLEARGDGDETPAPSLMDRIRDLDARLKSGVDSDEVEGDLDSASSEIDTVLSAYNEMRKRFLNAWASSNVAKVAAGAHVLTYAKWKRQNKAAGKRNGRHVLPVERARELGYCNECWTVIATQKGGCLCGIHNEATMTRVLTTISKGLSSDMKDAIRSNPHMEWWTGSMS